MAAGYRSLLGFWEPTGVNCEPIAGYFTLLGFWYPRGIGSAANPATVPSAFLYANFNILL